VYRTIDLNAGLMSNCVKKSELRLSLLIVFLALVSLLADAQNKTYYNEIQDYISNHIPIDNQNWRISQSPKTGYTYFANSAGLIEYNGISSRVFSMPYKQGVRSVLVNADGRIFTGSFEDFGYWEENREGELAFKSLARGIVVNKNDEIWNIYEEDGAIYFQSFTTIYRVQNNQVEKIPGPSFMLFMFPVEKGFIVQALGTGLYRFDGKSFSFIPGSGIFESLKVLALICRNNGEYWICTVNNGIYIYNGHSFRPQNSSVSDFLKEGACNAGLAINDSLIVFGTILKGIVFCDGEGNIKEAYDYSNGLHNNTVLSLSKDARNGLWIGLDDGANYINAFSPETLYANFSGTLGTIYTALMNKGSLYLGTNHGLFVADISQKGGIYNFKDLRIIPNTQGQVWKLAQYNDQILCGHNEGTFLLDNGKFRLISDVTGGWAMRQYNNLLLEGTYTGIISFGLDKNGKWSYRNRIKGYIEPSRYIEVDYKGYVWATHPQKGIYRLEMNDLTDTIVNTLYFSSIADTLNKVALSKINNQVVFLTSEYIYAFDYEKKTFYPLKSLEQGLGEYIKSTQIIPYQKNSYWFIMGNKIALFDISRDLQATRILEFFHKYAELPGREQEIISLDSKTLLIPTRQAFTTYDIDMLGNPIPSPLIKIDHLYFSGKSTGRIIIPDRKETITIPNKENNVSVYIANPANFENEDQEYQYRIIELGEKWHTTIFDNFSFLNLQFGSYHLQVKTSTGENITEVFFKIERPNYLSTAALVTYFILVVILIIAGIKIFKHELSRHRRLIEYEVGKNRLESELD
jgi:ligand-binding sensor domain-containing protein